MPRPHKLVNPYESWSAIFGATLQRLRRGMRSSPEVTQAEFGRLIGYSEDTVSAVERAVLRPHEKFVESIASKIADGGVLKAMLPFVTHEWSEWQRLGRSGSPAGILPPAEWVADPSQLRDPRFLEAAADGVTEAKALAREAEASDIGGGTLETIDIKVDRFCRDYPTTLPGMLEPRVKRKLREVRRHLRRNLTLAQHRHLLVAGGWLSILLACLQFDRGDREAAEETRDAAFQLANEADTHQEILAWSFELLAWFALVEGRYDDTVEHARTGLLLAPNGSAGVQLAVQEARGLARMGKVAETEDALRRGGTILSKLPVPAHPEHHLVFDAPKFSFYASTCYTWLGEAERASEQANEVVALCLAVPGTIRWPVRLAETRVDMALLAVGRGQLDEAHHLGHLALASERKAGSTIGRVAELDAALVERHPDAPETRDFHEEYLAARRALQQGAI